MYKCEYIFKYSILFYIAQGFAMTQMFLVYLIHFHPRPRIGYFPKDLWFLLLENGVQSPLYYLHVALCTYIILNKYLLDKFLYLYLYLVLLSLNTTSFMKFSLFFFLLPKFL